MMLAALGLFVFRMPDLAFEELSRRTDWRHARTERIGARAAVQFVGPGVDTITLHGALVPEAGGRFAALDTLRAMADTGETLAFVAGTGQILGHFVILSMDERAGHFIAEGAPRKTDFTIELGRVD